MSATILHHGHIRLLKKASKYGNVIVGLTKDKEIKKYKGYYPTLKYKHRKEILNSIKYVSKVVSTNFYITNKDLKKNKSAFIVHGSDNKNKVDKSKCIIFPRTKKISSTLIRKAFEKK